MDLISRADALNKGFKHYFNGGPCLRGHVARRYVTNGACVDCLNEKAGRAPATKRGVARRPPLSEMRLRVYDVDWPMVRAIAHAFFHAVAPDMTPPADRSPRARTCGTSIYVVRVPDQYTEDMRASADALFATHRPDMTTIRANILRTVCAMADEHGARPD